MSPSPPEVLELNRWTNPGAPRRGIQVGIVQPPVRERKFAVEQFFAEPPIVAFPAGHRLERFSRVAARTLADEAHVFVSRRRRHLRSGVA
jgi:hypothetical protein